MEREEKLDMWRQREAATQEAQAELIEKLIPYLGNRIRRNAEIRDQLVFLDAGEDLQQKISDMDFLPEGRSDEEVFGTLVNDILEYGASLQHPHFMSYVTSSVSPYSLATAILSDVYNHNGGGFAFCPTAGIAEEKAARWMADCAGLPDTAAGVFVSGGSMANFTGQLAARDNMLEEKDWVRGTAYFSNQTHASTEKALHMIGLRRENIVKVDVDDEFKIDLAALREAIERDIAAGKKPFLIVGNLGTTNTGAIDPLDDLADIAKEYGMWLHVDGAFGGSILASKKYRVLAKGIERIDSMAWDGHKWLMQTYSCSCALFRDRTQAVKAFAVHPEYLATICSDEHTDSWDIGPEMSRPFRGLKLWTTLQALGTDQVSILIGKAWHMTKAAKEEFDVREGWEILAPPCCGTIAFRYVPEGWTDMEKINDLNSRISQRTIREQRFYVAETLLKGKVAMRLNMINVTITDEDVRRAVAYLQECAEKEVAATE